MIVPFLSAMLSVAAAQAQALPPPATSRPAIGAGSRRALFISPMGEPFWGDSTRGGNLEAWFVQADTNGDRSLSVKESQDDAARFFAVLDRTKDREIDPDDINYYETSVVPEIRMMGAGYGSRPRYSTVPTGTGVSAGDYGRGSDAGARTAGGDLSGRTLKKVPEVGLKGAGRWGLLNIPEPVTSADANFNRGVSEFEFLKAAATRFALIDSDRDGKLALDELQARLADLPSR